jgi:hypothetical protein
VDQQSAFEAQEQVLAVGVDAGDGAAFEAFRPAVAPEARVRRLDRVRDPAFEDGPDPVGGVVDGVALRH